MLLTTVALTLAGTLAALAPPATGAKAAPMTVRVEVAPSAAPVVQAWGTELRASLETRKDEFRLAKAGENPQVVVRLDTVVPGANGKSVMNGALVQGKDVRIFNITFVGEVRPWAEKLARNLRRLIEQPKTPPPAAKR